MSNNYPAAPPSAMNSQPYYNQGAPSVGYQQQAAPLPREKGGCLIGCLSAIFCCCAVEDCLACCAIDDCLQSCC